MLFMTSGQDAGPSLTGLESTQGQNNVTM